MYNIDNTNQLIDLIYEAAIKPSKWTDLLNALAELVDSAEVDLENPSANKDLLSAITNTESNASISQALKSISNINEVQTNSNTADLGQVNDLLMGHFSQAIKIAKRIVDVDEQHNIVLSLLDRMPVALVLVDSMARVIETNDLADEILTSEGGLTVKSNILDSGAGNNKRLFNAIDDMSKHEPALTRGQSLSITNEQTQNNIMLFIAPLKQTSPKQQASVAIFISQRKSLPLSLSGEFSEHYELTNKEIIVTEQLVRGLSVQEISDEACISEHTVRSHVKSILKKTDTSRQAELVSLVYNGMTNFGSLISENEASHKSGVLNKTKTWQQDYNVLSLKDGRNLAYQEYGDLNGEPVFHCHSVLGSRLELAFNAKEISKQKSVRLIVPDRPGYGASDPDPETSFTKWAKDLVQLADHLKIEKFCVTGYVMGSVYAQACAHEIPERIKRIAVICGGFAPTSRTDYETITPLVKLNYRLAKYFPKLYSLVNTIQIKSALNDPDSFIKQFSKKLDIADQQIMRSEPFRAHFVDALSEGYRQGDKVLSRDVIQVMNEWAFEPSNINVPVDMWHGTCDFVVPFVLSERLSEQIKTSRCFIKEGEGQYMFYTHWEEILDELLDNKTTRNTVLIFEYLSRNIIGTVESNTGSE